MAKVQPSDADHANDAKARAKRMLRAGAISAAEHAKLVEKADKVLSNGKS